MKFWQHGVIRLVATTGVTLITINNLGSTQGIILLICVMAIGFSSEKMGERFGLFKSLTLLEDIKKIREDVNKDIETLKGLEDDRNKV